jgi:hypothetical protein
MKSFLNKPLAILLFCSFLSHSTFGQDTPGGGGGGGGGESAAESSVTTSSSKKSAIIPETVEANPIANVIRAGLPIREVSLLLQSNSAENLRTITSVGSITDLQNLASSVKSGSSDLATISEVIVSNVAAGLTINSATALNRSEGVKTIEVTYATLPVTQLNALIASLKDASQTIDQAAAVKRAIVVQDIVSEFGGSATTAQLDALLSDAIDTTKSVAVVQNTAALAVSQGAANLSSLVEVDSDGNTVTSSSYTALVESATAIADSGQTIDSSKSAAEIEVDALTAAGFTTTQIAVLQANGYTSADIGNIKTIEALSQSIGLIDINGDTITETIETSTAISKDDIIAISKSKLDEFVTTINTVTVDDSKYALFQTLSTFKDQSDVNTNLSEIGLLINSILVDKTSAQLGSISAYRASVLETKGYLDELAVFLSKYNILGPNGQNVVNLLNGNTMDKKQTSLSGYVGALATYTGSRTFGDDFDLSVANIPTENVDLYPARNFDLSGTIDLDNDTDFPNVAPAPLTNNNVNSADIEIMVIAAAKDLTISGDLKIENDNHVEDHALVIAAADDLYLRSEYSSANANDYSNPENLSIEYEGSNLAIASQDSMVLVNVDIKTGGNLAIGTLGDLAIGLSDVHDSSIDIGSGGNTPSADNLYLYASELLSINGLDIRGHVRKVYMEGQTVNLTDVHFPAGSLALLRSQVGQLNFGSTPIDGYVNLNDVTHASINNGAALTTSDFSGTVGHINSNLISPDGTPYIRIRGQEASAN